MRQVLTTHHVQYYNIDSQTLQLHALLAYPLRHRMAKTWPQLIADVQRIVDATDVPVDYDGEGRGRPAMLRIEERYPSQRS